MHPIISTQTRKCYLCGASDPDSEDHVPPKGFFPDPKPENLIKLPCCKSCNNSFSSDDEAFRLFVSVAIGVSPAGEWIRNNKSLKTTLLRSPKLVQHIKNSIGTILRDGKFCDTLSLPTCRGKRFLERLTKGLLANFYPEIDRNLLEFRVINIAEERICNYNLEVLRNESVYDSRGDGVFQFRRIICKETATGIWMYVFYGASLFLVWHGRNLPQT